MNPFSPHLEEAFTLLREHMRSTDPRVSIRACRTIIAADLRYKMLEYTALRAEYSALKLQHTTPAASLSEAPAATVSSDAASDAPRTAQSASRSPRPPAPPRFDELREELRLAPEHRELVTTAWRPDREGGVQPAITPEPRQTAESPQRAPCMPQCPPRSSPASLLASAAGASNPFPHPLTPPSRHRLPNTT